MSYPQDMIFLAQINFEEVPPNETLPQKGILQFFIANDDTYGLFLEPPGFRVIYYENITKPIQPSVSASTDFLRSVCDHGGSTYVMPAYLSLLHNEEYESPMEKSGKMEFRKSSELISYGDYLFPQIHEDDYDDLNIYDDYAGEGDKLLGYPFFTQWDPREHSPEYDILLLQIDTSDYIMWGDGGVCNFFINKEKLKKADFSDILYNWDCY